MLEDCREVARIEAESFTDPWTQKSFEETLHYANNKYYVMEIEKNIVGFAGISIAMEESDLITIAIAKNYRGQGLGSVFLKHIMNQAQEYQARKMTLEVRISNEAAIALYKHNCFDVIAVRKKYYKNPTEDAYIMQLAI